VPLDPEALGPDFVPRARSEGLAVEELDGEGVIYDDAFDAVHHLNTSALAVWSGCDGTMTVQALADDIAAITGADRAEVLPAVLDAVASFAERGLLEGIGPPRPPQPDLEERAAPRFLQGPPEY
jgi:hypothetical protein